MEPVLPVVALPAPEAAVEPVLPVVALPAPEAAEVPVHPAVEPARSAQQMAGRECRSAMEAVAEPVPGQGQSDPSPAQVAVIPWVACPVPQPLPYR